MIRHIVAFTFADHTDADLQADILAELDALPEHFPAMQGWSRGRNISRRDRTFDHAFVVDFNTEDELVTYLDSDRHERFVADRWRPNIRVRAITSFAFER